MKKLIKKILISKYFINFLNFFLVKILKLKEIIDESYSGVGKFLFVKDSDLFVVSYPKSGNTWLRLIVGKILFKNLNYNNLDKFIPEPYFYRESAYIQTKDNFRIFKSHDYFDHRFKKVIYVIRDPREVLVSSYFFQIKIGSIIKNYSKRLFVREFLRGKFNANFGNWEQNVGSWFGSKKSQIIFVKYEDLISNTKSEIIKIAKFLGKNLSKKKLNSIVKKTSFNNLKKNEKEVLLNWRSIKKNNSDIFFFRSGKTNSWKNFLTKKENHMIKKKWSTYMKIFNYN